MSFNLFAAEEEALAKAHAMEERLAELAPDCLPEFRELVAAFELSTREQRRLVRVSDRLQAQLSDANHELDRRRSEAEAALDRLREAQEAMIQSEKLASLGALVAGVAHEINTPVGIAVSCASHLADSTQAIRRRAEEGELSKAAFARYLATAVDTTDLILGNCERAAQLIAGFKQVAVDRTSALRRSINLAACIHDTLVSLQPKLRPSGHAVAVDCPVDLELDSYPGVLSQILSNLVMNALTHAFADGRVGDMTITAQCPDPDTVRLCFTDNGRGMSEEHRARVFEPFFTTTRSHGGSGLGLHIVHNLVVGALMGAITVDSAPDRGTSFILIFPRRTPDTDRAGQDATPERP
ncbi:two-component sensor histidine kinase [Azospirillum sp. B510]|uniref:sensor histidine kinase n=1 Tax=Azospirillum sp. (strain B510) TaxID=137722 RepID=UPI0001C4BF47|nr:HAMP domain-containing sensor histidine kinase [Azospirillum sp. B510]BAI72289.1 two-component sensor histidine kinase [Azospirillum sp. B510]